VIGLSLLLLGCPKPASPTAVPALPSDAPKPRPDGPVAGPRYVVEDLPPPPPSPDTPGQGPLVPYLSTVRKAVMTHVGACLDANAVVPPRQPVLVVAVLDAEGKLVDVALRRSSGSPGVDACTIHGFRVAEIRPPPPEVLSPEGTLQTPDIAILPPTPAPAP
jgi:hypothetical protein